MLAQRFRAYRQNKKLIDAVNGYMFIAPFIILAAVFILYPMAKGLYNSVFDFRFGRMSFVGMNNYIKVFSNETYLMAIRNTMLFVFTVVPMLCIIGILIAGSIFDKAVRYTSFVRICLYIPVIASAAVMSIIWRFMLDSQNGLLRYIYNIFSVEPFNVLGNTTTAKIVLILVLFTVNIGQCVILYVASMIGIPKELIEALEIDGGNRLDIFRYILIPLTSPTTLLNFVTQTSAIIRVFVLIQLLTNGGPSRSTTSMMYLLYQEGFANGNFGLASALGVVLFLFSILLVFVQFRAIKSSEK